MSLSRPVEHKNEQQKEMGKIQNAYPLRVNTRGKGKGQVHHRTGHDGQEWE